jgi:hypothetical protein
MPLSFERLSFPLYGEAEELANQHGILSSEAVGEPRADGTCSLSLAASSLLLPIPD